MSHMQTLDTVTISLSGTKLIEASAGTGKTYAITGLYIRLLLEQELSVDKILVLTFTEAATKELRSRVRNRLQDALAVYEGRELSDDFLNLLYKKHFLEGRNIQKCRQRLILALHSIDLAAIFTIHGFCARVLQDSAFESGHLFDLDLCENDTELLGQIIDDFWRKEVGSWHDLFLLYLFGKNINADTLFVKLQGVVQIARKAGLKSIDTPQHMSPAKFHFSMDELASIWQQSQEKIMELLQSPALSKAKAKGYHLDNVLKWQKEIDTFFHASKNALLPVEAFEKLSTSCLIAGTKPSKLGETPEHEFFCQSEQLIEQLSRAYNGLCLAIIEYCLVELPEKKNAEGLLSFDDLLLLVRDGLRHKESGRPLAEKIRQQYQALLIDEFQDTDAVQYEIFQTVYGQRKNSMFLIGDPKQAIYRFRGADIYAYLQAIKGAGSEVYGMDTNWRSEPGLVHGYNLLFGNTGSAKPFFIPEIQYHQVKASEKEDAVLVTEEDGAQPLSFVTFDQFETKDKAKQYISQDLAKKMKNLIALGQKDKAYFFSKNPGESVGNKRQQLTAGQMAVLVRSHKDGELVRSALFDEGIRSVLHSRQEVLGTNEARELLFILAGILHSTDVRRIKTALATSILGWKSHEVLDLDADEGLWQQTVERFLEYLKLWEEKGFAVMAYRMLSKENAITFVSGCRNAERRLTNIRHIIEILQEASHHEGFSPMALFDWFQKQRQVEEKNEERLLRLESDENLVKIVTIHKSKGLEYPLVFCPFLWDSPFQVKKDKGWVAWHDEAGNERVDMGTETFAKRYQQQVDENMAEEFRLLYVALTRARNRCYIYWGNVLSKKNSVSAKSALGYLLKSFSPPDQTCMDFKNDKPQGSYGVLCEPLYEMAACSPEAVGVCGFEIAAEFENIKSEPTAELLPIATNFRHLEPSWSILSFSALLRSEKEGKEEEAHDDLFLSQESDRECPFDDVNFDKNLFNFPRGAQAGSCLHDIFETMDFTSCLNANNAKRVQGALDKYGISSDWSTPLLHGLDRILKTDLDADRAGLCLTKISIEQRVNELEFYYSIPKPPNRAFQDVFRGKNVKLLHEKNSTQKEERKSSWYMKGFIDLIFEWQGQYFIVDYKSNYLGKVYEDYHHEKLTEAMIKSGYDMQYHIYLVALHRYLQQRIPNYDYDTHIGGVYYLFLRGMAPEKGPEFGVFKDRPKYQVIENMEKILLLDGESVTDLEVVSEGQTHG